LWKRKKISSIDKHPIKEKREKKKKKKEASHFKNKTFTLVVTEETIRLD
jgi:hypothetical protein